MLNREGNLETLFVYFYSALPFTKSSFRKDWIEAERGTRKCEDGHNDRRILDLEVQRGDYTCWKYS